MKAGLRLQYGQWQSFFATWSRLIRVWHFFFILFFFWNETIVLFMSTWSLQAMIAFEESEHSKHRQENEPRCWFVFLFLAFVFCFLLESCDCACFPAVLFIGGLRGHTCLALEGSTYMVRAFSFWEDISSTKKRIFAKESSHPHNSKVDSRLGSSITYSEPSKYLALKCWGKTYEIPTCHGQRKKEKNTWYNYIYKTERLALVFREMQFCRRSSIALRGSFGRVLFRSNNGVCVLTIFRKTCS